MRKSFRKLFPSQESVKNNRWLKPFGSWLHHHNLWHLNRRSVAGGVAVGLLCGLVPGPLQVLSSVPLAVMLRVNLPVAVFTTLYTNPFTILPLYVLAYEIGAWVSGVKNGGVKVELVFPELHWDSWMDEMWNWLLKLGEPLLFGLPILAICLSILGYFAVRVAWRVVVVLKWRARKKKRSV